MYTYSDDWSYDQTYHWHVAADDADKVYDKARHTLKDGICATCGVVPVGTEGLEYELSYNKTYYIVTGISAPEQKNILSPSYHEGLPVGEIKDSAFSGNDAIERVKWGIV